MKGIINKIISFFVSLFNVSDGREPDETPAQTDVTGNKTEENNLSNNSKSRVYAIRIA